MGGERGVRDGRWKMEREGKVGFKKRGGEEE